MEKALCSSPSTGPARPPCEAARPVRSRADRDLVLDFLHAVDVAGDAFRGGTLGGALRASGQHHRAFEGLDLDGAGIDGLVVDHAGLHLSRDGRVVDIGADRLLAAYDGAPR